ncbi:hypothetical protein D9M71_728850 [compost metagenome]
MSYASLISLSVTSYLSAKTFSVTICCITYEPVKAFAFSLKSATEISPTLEVTIALLSPPLQAPSANTDAAKVKDKTVFFIVDILS